MRFLIDMNLSRGWVAILSEAGHQAEYWRDIGPATALDSEIMSFARAEEFVVLTRDSDFGEMLALNAASGPSVVQLRDGDTMPEVSGSRVVKAITRFYSEIEHGALVTIYLSRAKVRILPIKRTQP